MPTLHQNEGDAFTKVRVFRFSTSPGQLTPAVTLNGWTGDAPFQLPYGDTCGNEYSFHGNFING